MATTRSARTRRRKLSQSAAAIAKRQKRAELRAATDARSTSEVTLGQIPQRQLDQLERVADKLTEIHRIGAETMNRALVTIGDKSDPEPSRISRAEPAAPTTAAGRQLGIIEEATSRVDHAAQRILSARLTLRGRIEKLTGPIAEAAGSNGKDSPVPSGDVHGLHFALNLLDSEISALFDHVDRLAGL